MEFSKVYKNNNIFINKYQEGIVILENNKIKIFNEASKETNIVIKIKNNDMYKIIYSDLNFIKLNFLEKYLLINIITWEIYTNERDLVGLNQNLKIFYNKDIYSFIFFKDKIYLINNKVIKYQWINNEICLIKDLNIIIYQNKVFNILEIKLQLIHDLEEKLFVKIKNTIHLKENMFLIESLNLITIISISQQGDILILYKFPFKFINLFYKNNNIFAFFKINNQYLLYEINETEAKIIFSSFLENNIRKILQLRENNFLFITLNDDTYKLYKTKENEIENHLKNKKNYKIELNKFNIYEYYYYWKNNLNINNNNEIYNNINLIITHFKRIDNNSLLNYYKNNTDNSLNKLIIDSIIRSPFLGEIKDINKIIEEFNISTESKDFIINKLFEIWISENYLEIFNKFSRFIKEKLFLRYFNSDNLEFLTSNYNDKELNLDLFLVLNNNLKQLDIKLDSKNIIKINYPEILIKNVINNLLKKKLFETININNLKINVDFNNTNDRVELLQFLYNILNNINEIKNSFEEYKIESETYKELLFNDLAIILLTKLFNLQRFKEFKLIINDFKDEINIDKIEKNIFKLEFEENFDKYSYLQFKNEIYPIDIFSKKIKKVRFLLKKRYYGILHKFENKQVDEFNFDDKNNYNDPSSLLKFIKIEFIINNIDSIVNEKFKNIDIFQFKDYKKFFYNYLKKMFIFNEESFLDILQQLYNKGRDKFLYKLFEELIFTYKSEFLQKIYDFKKNYLLSMIKKNKSNDFLNIIDDIFVNTLDEGILLTLNDFFDKTKNLQINFDTSVTRKELLNKKFNLNKLLKSNIEEDTILNTDEFEIFIKYFLINNFSSFDFLKIINKDNNDTINSLLAILRNSKMFDDQELINSFKNKTLVKLNSNNTQELDHDNNSAHESVPEDNKSLRRYEFYILLKNKNLLKNEKDFDNLVFMKYLNKLFNLHYNLIKDNNYEDIIIDFIKEFILNNEHLYEFILCQNFVEFLKSNSLFEIVNFLELEKNFQIRNFFNIYKFLVPNNNYNKYLYLMVNLPEDCLNIKIFIKVTNNWLDINIDNLKEYIDSLKHEDLKFYEQVLNKIYLKFN